MSLKKDSVFATHKKVIKPFEFNEEVAQVFDDMVSRSVPFYEESHRVCADMALRFYRGSGHIIDLGCSTGTTISFLHKVLKDQCDNISFKGVDSSESMLALAQKKCSHIENARFYQDDMCEADLSNSEIVILNYTLQFISIEKRLSLLQKIYDGLLPGGILIVSEKIRSPQAVTQELITDLYYDFKKRNGYSELEISQKREALENVLVPLTPQEQLTMFEDAGFDQYDMLFRWYNFASYLARKSHA